MSRLSMLSRQLSTASPSPTMQWGQYFTLRRSRRRWATLAAVPTSVGGVVLGGGYFANLETSPGSLIAGFDPLIVYGAAMVACVAGGWLSGPILGNAVWRATHRSVRKEMERMDAVFLRHIRERRVDPSRQSVNNPVPDYYGEHVMSLRSYRQWLRDQAAYKRKARFGEGSEAAL